MLVKLMIHNTGPNTTTLKRMSMRMSLCLQHNLFVSDMVNPSKNTVSKKLWSFIKSKRKDNIGGVSSLSFQGETHTDPLVKAKFVNYSSVYTNEDTSFKYKVKTLSSTQFS